MAGLQKAIAQLMEGRQERPQERTDPPALAQLLAAVRAGVGAEENAPAEAFARELFAKTLPTLAQQRDPATLGAMAAAAYGFLRDRGDSPIAVRVFTPQREREGWSSPLTVVESVLDDRPFIVETLTEAIESAGGEIRLLLHPQLSIERTAEGTILRIGGPESAAIRESFFHAEVANVPATAAFQQQLAERLRQVVRVTGDYAAMRDRITALARELHMRALPAPWDGERAELAAFLDWLGNKSFVFLGYREYDVHGASGARTAAVRPGSGLGLLHDEAGSHYQRDRPLPMPIARQIDRPPLWIVSTTRAVSPVHRAVPMDDVAIKSVDASGAVVRVHRLIGLFTAKAYADAASELPILRRRLAAVLAREGVVEESHDYRDLVGLFNSLPRQELLASDVEDIRQVMDAIRAADPRGGIELLCQPDPLGRGFFATVLVPRARFSTELHGSVSRVLRRAFRADVLSEHLSLDNRPIARLHYAFAVPSDVLVQPPIDTLRAELNALLRTWDDELRDRLAETHARTDAERLATRYARALPPAYKASTSVAVAARDLGALEALATTGRPQVELLANDQRGARALKLYLGNETLVLSDFIPVLENLGLRVLGQDVVELRLPDVGAASIHTFTVDPAVVPADVDRAARPLVEAVHALRAGTVENDRLNTLVLSAGLEWRSVDLLRATVEHARQANLGSHQTLIEALTANPAAAARLFRYFAAKFDPSASPLAAAERAAGPIAAAHREFLASLDTVEHLTHDRILRALGDTISATVRTNFYATPAGGPIALKLEAAQLAHLPVPRPAVETWVHTAHMNGVHLRAARIARGGVRASDRPDDFRAEILGLMRTQIVKNAVIVPGGAKGGFIVKRSPRGTPADPESVEAAYRQFIAALLSITDNRANGQMVAPTGLLVHDAPDPYLVVAADKGTAGFSDVANAIAAERDFWLGDAFASGGRHGYDHKRLGITARGAWECAREHFRDMGRDLDHSTVTVVGIGDMSGDVFGNGLLRSRHLRLLAAFNHRDVFLDPDPDPELSYRERERLFHLPGSGWGDYAAQSISRGGGVYPRAAKSIALSPEARTMLGIAAATAPPGEDVVRAILRLQVDLLWNGGVGTYVKATDESHGDVGDPGNDAVRIDARELRAAVVVEGGNLGLTQRARIEYAINGGRINSDAIDNSGGVDLSDHEVNLKIALQPAVAAGELGVEPRNALLAEVADAVCDAVLEHNRSQAHALTLEQLRSRTQLAPFRDLMTILEAEAGLDRQLVQLPSREALRARRSAFLGLTRPELALLMAHTKIDLRQRLDRAQLTDEPELKRYLEAYFPSDVAQRFASSISKHPLRREIVALGVANELVDTMGMTFLVRAVRDTGRDVLDIVRAWVAAREITGAAELYGELRKRRLGAQPAQRGMLALAGAIERAALWLVRSQMTARPLAESIVRFREPVATLLASWPKLLTPECSTAHQAAVERLAATGLEPSLAARLVQLGAAEEALEIAHIAQASGAPLTSAAEGYFGGTSLVDLDWLRDVLPSTLPGEDRWEPRAVASLLEVVLEMRRSLTQQILAYRRGETPIAECLEQYAAAAHDQLGVVSGLINDQKGAAQPTLAALLVVIREVGRLVRPPAPA